MHKLRLAYLALTATALGPLGAHAETARTALPPAVAGVIACMPVAEPAARLACLDKAAAALQAAAGGGDLVILDRQQVRKSQRENLGRASPAELPGVPPGANSETFDVIAATQGVDSHWVLILKDGCRARAQRPASARARWAATSSRSTVTRACGRTGSVRAGCEKMATRFSHQSRSKYLESIQRPF
jgi:hypothetical protein